MTVLVSSVGRDYAHAILSFFDEPTEKSDAGVQAVFTYLLAYPNSAISDLIALTGFDEEKLRNYLDALGTLVAFDGIVWSISDFGYEKMKSELPITPGKLKLSTYLVPVGLSAAELSRWEEIKRIVMDTSPQPPHGATIRQDFESWFSYVDSNPPPTLKDVSGGRTPNPGEANAVMAFTRQGAYGVAIHRPGTQPVVDFGRLIKTFQFGGKDNILDGDGPLMEKALSLGLTLW